MSANRPKWIASDTFAQHRKAALFKMAEGYASSHVYPLSILRNTFPASIVSGGLYVSYREKQPWFSALMSHFVGWVHW
jgi:hypothetical protein